MSREGQRQVALPKIFLDNAEIRRKENCIFFGITIDDNLCWKDHVYLVNSKITKSLYLLSSAKHNYIISRHHLTKLYCALIHSHLTYGLILWGSSQPSNLLKKTIVLHKKAIRCINNAHYLAHSEPLFSKSNMYTNLKLSGWCLIVFTMSHRSPLIIMSTILDNV